MTFKKLKAIIDIIINNDEEQTPDVLNQNKIKGDMFERYVIDLFNKKYFTVENWTRDIDKNTISGMGTTYSNNLFTRENDC